MQKKIAILLMACLILTMIPAMSFADSTEAKGVQTNQRNFADVSGHWASEAIAKWASVGVVKGDSQGFRPNDSITRAEVAVVLDNLMGYQKKASNIFKDVPTSAWYADAILKANAAGILSGDGDGYAAPTENITREQAAVMLARAFGVEKGTAKTTSFKDAGIISSWAQPLVFGMEASQYIKGTDGGNFEPKANVTRAEVVTMIDNAVREYYTKPDTYTANVSPKASGANCVAIVKSDGVKIKGAKISGDLIIAEGVGDGNVTLDGTTVTGKLLARGGGKNSVHIINGAQVNGKVSVERVDGIVRIVSEGVTIASLDAETEVILEGSFTDVAVSEGASVEIKGQVKNIAVEAKSAVTVTKDATVDNILVGKNADGAKIEVSGTVNTVKTEAPKTEIKVTDTARVAKVEAAATAVGTNVSLDKKADVTALNNDSAITTSGEGAPKAITGNGKVTNNAANKTQTTTSSGGSGGGGGGSSSSGGSSSGGSGGSGGNSSGSGDNGNGGSSNGATDTTSPLVTASEVARISDTEATIKFASNEKGQYYYDIVEKDGAAPTINTAKAGQACNAGETTLNITLSAGAKDLYLVVKDDAGNISKSLKITIIANKNVLPNNYGIVMAFDKKVRANPAKIKLLTMDEGVKTITILDKLNVELAKGQVIAYELDQDGYISVMGDTSASIVIPTSLNIKSNHGAEFLDKHYEISNKVIVFTYSGTDPSNINCDYNINDINNLFYNKPINSSASILLENGIITAIFIPDSLVVVPKPTGLVGIAPTSSETNNGRITGVDATMEYKLATEKAYQPITGTEVTGLAAGTYQVRYVGKEGNGPGMPTLVEVSAYIVADNYGLVIAYDKDGLYGLRVNILEKDGNSKTYRYFDGFKVEVKEGQILAYGLDKYEDIGVMDNTNKAITFDSGVEIKNKTELIADSKPYTISDDVIVFTYGKEKPTDLNYYYQVSSINSISEGTINSPTSIYLDDKNNVIALLIPAQVPAQ